MSALGSCCSVLELRQYTLHPGQRDVLISLFEQHFIETQEAEGMHLIGQFRDEEKPDRFVWMRGFRDMESRRDALRSFYGGPVWKEHRNTANATMVDSDNVLLLRPVGEHGGLPHPSQPRPPFGTDVRPESRVELTLCYLKAPADLTLLTHFEQHVRPALGSIGAAPRALYQTDSRENTFPALPVRTGEQVFAWLTVFPNREHPHEHMRRRAESAPWRESLQPWLSAPLEHLTLAPTARSELR
ncbi:NIPSNAP family protein [Corallococcus sp. H22C18031201]|nr:NIPSNAP family protein [Corallococcus sp. H22C18031201]